ncbi:hypothetical protein G6K88_14205 [Agrobacterium rhizogenes]|uniref:hypothetical protein n=1 Tax=Rhizobium rhizogenes TaxID=359 RepID=UPI00115EC077|nr:hypothetical protein [Rhizobium rhizogenes]NTI03173.1 hypothetical protein [Rhizobium rhizogenes]NTI09977.1 hypothetical protein [Rhizobium rhizogenes]TRB21500.1 hypothetical protein EXN70_21575 [Rhizobium rhizogenes]
MKYADGSEDFDDVMTDVDRIIDDPTKEELQLKWIPFAEGFDYDDYDRYRNFLALSDDDQSAVMEPMTTTEAELYIALLTSRAMYVSPVDRNPGSITQDKVDAYPERYKWEPRNDG